MKRHHKPTDRRRPTEATGFTLVELMIVVAVVAILAAIAYPSYVDQVRRSQRASAQSFLMDVAARQQQRFVDVRSYADSLSATGMTAPDNVNARYNIVVNAVAGPPPTYTMTAAPIGAQAGDSCGTLSINNAGVKTPANCW